MLQIVSCRFFCLNGAAIPLPSMGVRGDGNSIVRYLGFPNTSSIRVELIRIDPAHKLLEWAATTSSAVAAPAPYPSNWRAVRGIGLRAVLDATKQLGP